MPTAHYTRIREFMQKAGQETPEAPEIPDEDTRILRATLILEEALETITALGVKVTVRQNGRWSTLNAGDTIHEFEAHGDVDLEGVVDGCADISVVTIGTLIAFGVDDEMILEEVDKANLRKFEAGSYRREDGKWMKPPDWTPPNIVGQIEAMGADLS